MKVTWLWFRIVLRFFVLYGVFFWYNLYVYSFLYLVKYFLRVFLCLVLFMVRIARKVLESKGKVFLWDRYYMKCILLNFYNYFGGRCDDFYLLFGNAVGKVRCFFEEFVVV